MLAGHQLEQRLLLRRVERETRALYPGQEGPQQDVRVGRRQGWKQIGEGGHPGPGTLTAAALASPSCLGQGAGRAVSTLRFTLDRTDGLARAGVLHTRRGDVPTPVFMPVATHAAFRHLSVDEAGEAGARILLANTYHLMLRPGPRGVRAARRHPPLHGVGRAGADRLGRLPDLLAARGPQITEEGARFRSFHDNSRQLLSPESSIEMQQAHRLGHHDGARRSASTRARTRPAPARRWSAPTAGRCAASAARAGDTGQALFAIVQGGVLPELRDESAAFLTRHPVRRLRHRRAGGGRDEAAARRDDRASRRGCFRRTGRAT